jgi:RHS repeat-associated protein
VYDGLGSVVGEVDPLGNLTCANEYDVYGAVRGRTGTATTAHGFVGNLGHLSDASTGLIYMKARYYDPSTGRFESQDTGGQGDNWFAYCADNPTNLVDADGKSPWTVGEEGAWIAGIYLATAACAVAICSSPLNKASTWVANSLATLAVVAFTYASLGGLDPDMKLVMANVRSFTSVISIMIAGANLGNRSCLPGAGVMASLTLIYGLALLGAVAACQSDMEN